MKFYIGSFFLLLFPGGAEDFGHISCIVVAFETAPTGMRHVFLFDKIRVKAAFVGGLLNASTHIGLDVLNQITTVLA